MSKTKKRIIIAAAVVVAIVVALLIARPHFACSGAFSKSDKEIIFSGISGSASEGIGSSNGGEEPILHVYEITDPDELKVLRAVSKDMSIKTISSTEYQTLARRMVATVSDTTVGGVGIAGPQVGINKRVVAVQRFDKEGKPFEVYPNIQIVSMSDSTRCGAEGCLSVPNRRENVVRSAEVVISYIDPTTLKPATETIRGFTAVIFQHEIDHLEGIIYTDRVK